MLGKSASVCVLSLLFASSWLWVFYDSKWQALWPSIVALIVVLVTRKALIGLLVGAASGAVILSGGDLWEAYLSLFRDHLAPSFGSPWKMGAVAFTLILGGFAAVLEKGGGLSALVNRFLASKTDPAKGLQMSAFLLGLVCFFDGLANSLLVGRLTQSLASRCRVSREKLAYIVDSTSSAVACVAFVSTWVAYQLSMIVDGFEQLGQEVNPYGYFLTSIPYNYYCWFTLVLVIIVIQKDFLLGSMRRAESLAREQDAVTEPQKEQPFGESSGVRPHTVILPLLALLVSVLLGFYFIGLYEPIVEGAFEGYLPLTQEKVATAFGTSQGPLILVLAGLVASALALILYPCKRASESAVSAYVGGMRSLASPLLILAGAWMLSSTIGALDAKGVLSQLTGDYVSLSLLPVLIFGVGALISFSTGTSWGTMGILMPLAIPLIGQHPDVVGPEQLNTLYAAAIGAVFSGAVFGDHCSPISDTTIVSSIACGLEPHEHVKTQLPYAFLAAVVAAGLGFIPAAYGVSPWVCLLFGSGTLLGSAFLLKR